jgi:pilus assembly protein CpaC
MFTRCLARLLMPLVISGTLPLAAAAAPPAATPSAPPATRPGVPPPPSAVVPPANAPTATPVNPSILFKVRGSSERLEMTVHTSRILTMDQKIPQAQVNNPDILELTPLSPNQIQVSAKAAGVTQINLWGEDQKLFTIDVVVVGDARELAMVLRNTFPNAALKITPIASSVLISGYVDQPEHIDRIIRIAEEYYPKVVNNMTVGGVQQVLLHVKVMEVSRTKLRRLGFDFAKVTGSSVVGSGIAGLLQTSVDTSTGLAPAVAGNPFNTFAFGIVNGKNAFYGFLDALRQDNLLKVVADPTLVTVSGRAASFVSGGEIPIPVPQSLGTISIEWKQYGTQVDFVPIVLGNGRIRLEVRPRVSELDDARSLTIQGTVVPGILCRQADTGVEMQAGQTLAIAGLVQTYVEASNAGLPWISEVPYLGVLFRKEEERRNDVELLMLVTPELVEAMDASEVPPCGPGMQTTDPSDWELFMKGHLEVPNCCPAGGNGACQNGTASNAPAADGNSGGSGSPADESRPSGPQNRYSQPKPNPSSASSASGSPNGSLGFIGPVGYDVVK